MKILHTTILLAFISATSAAAPSASASATDDSDAASDSAAAGTNGSRRLSKLRGKPSLMGGAHAAAASSSAYVTMDSDTAAGSSRKLVAAKSAKAKAEKLFTGDITGSYFGTDTEDGTLQRLFILCDEEDKEDSPCNITLADVQFSTCYAITRDFFIGVAVAINIPRNKLDDFQLQLYCAANNTTPGSIDFNENPTAILTGNLVTIPGGGVQRTGTGFFYNKISVNGSSNNSKSGKASNSGGIANGKYVGTDSTSSYSPNDELSIFCGDGKDEDDQLCDIDWGSADLQICSGRGDTFFFTGFGLAQQVPRESLSNFVMDIYCLSPDQRKIDVETATPTITIEASVTALRDGIISFTYADKNNNAIAGTRDMFKIFEAPPKLKGGDIAFRGSGTDIEDGSIQALTVICEVDLCNVTLIDAFFSTCIENIQGENYLGGLAIATDVPQDSLDDFALPLYCVKDYYQLASTGIDYDGAPTATLNGSLVFLADGIIQRTANKFTYFNTFKSSSGAGVAKGKGKAAGKKEGTLISNGRYNGDKFFDGSQEAYNIYCEGDDKDSVCEVVLSNQIFTECYRYFPNVFVFNGFGYAKITRKDLDDFEIGIFCVPSAGATVNITSDLPNLTVDGSLAPASPAGRIERVGSKFYWKVTVTED